ncbi:SRPBCC domain-containing protein [uncultured Arthrobacter sp.]|uniref:SRPBCC family protein n=1 Tax=uncultured Arthrobacter sp. TaxID=114050 RepID=UPI00321720AC
MNEEASHEETGKSEAGNAQPGGLVLNLECTLDVSPEVVFRMLTDPAELVTWWGPHGFTIPAADLNLTVGGRYRFRMTPPDGEPFHLSGEFLEIDPPWRLVYTFRWEEPAPDDRETVADLSLLSAGDGTRLMLSQGPFLTEERLALHRNGWTESFEKLQAVLASRS